MSKLSYRVSYYVLYVLFAAILVVLGLFYLGGEMAVPIVPEMSSPIHTDTLLYLIYGLVGLTILATVVGFIAQFIAALKDNPISALKSLLGVILLAGVLIVSWVMGSDQALEITGYEGNENVPFWLKLTDMFLYSLYFLLAIAVVAMLGSGIKRRFS